MTWEKILKIIIIIVVIVIIIAIISNIKACPDIDKPTLRYEKIKDKLKTGDVIATHGCTLVRSHLMRKYLGCKATHVAMVIKKPDDIYIIELGPYGFHPLRKSDVRIRTLRSMMKKSEHSVFALIPAEKEIEWTEEDEERYKDFKFNYFVPTMFAPYKKYKVCSTFIGKIHEDKGLLNENHHLLSPCDFYNSENTIFFTKPGTGFAW